MFEEEGEAEESLVLIDSLKPGQLFRSRWDMQVHECSEYPLKTYSWKLPDAACWYDILPKDSTLMLIDIQYGYHQDEEYYVKPKFFRAIYLIFLYGDKRIFKYFRLDPYRPPEYLRLEGLFRLKK